MGRLQQRLDRQQPRLAWLPMPILQSLQTEPSHYLIEKEDPTGDTGHYTTKNLTIWLHPYPALPKPKPDLQTKNPLWTIWYWIISLLMFTKIPARTTNTYLTVKHGTWKKFCQIKITTTGTTQPLNNADRHLGVYVNRSNQEADKNTRTKVNPKISPENSSRMETP